MNGTSVRGLPALCLLPLAGAFEKTRTALGKLYRAALG